MRWTRDPAFAWALPGARPAGPPPGGWPALVRRSREERTLPLVARAAALAGLEVPAEGVAEVRRAVFARAVVRASAQARLAEAFRAARLPFVPLKGWSLERRVYPERGLRDMGDLDVLVRREDAARAAAALRGLGHDVEEPPSDPGGGPGIYRNSVHGSRGDGGPPVHLHWHPLNASLPVGLAAPRVRVEEVWNRAIEEADGASMADRNQEIVLLAEHAVKHSLRPASLLVDIAWALSAGASEARAAAWAERWGLGLPLHAVLALLAEAGARVDASVVGRLARHVRGFDGRAFLRQARTGRRWEGMSGLAYLSMCDGVAGRIAFVRGSLRPPDDAVRSFGKDPARGVVWRRLGRAVRMIAGEPRAT